MTSPLTAAQRTELGRLAETIRLDGDDYANDLAHAHHDLAGGMERLAAGKSRAAFNANCAALETLVAALLSSLEDAERRPYSDIRAERERQDAQWGGPSHDDEHGVEDWQYYRSKFEARVRAHILTPNFRPQEWLTDTRDSLIKTAALCVAQLESLDRAHPNGVTAPSPHTPRSTT